MYADHQELACLYGYMGIFYVHECLKQDPLLIVLTYSNAVCDCLSEIA